jgi:outer membrane protein assembly factor BamE (lipoprotein component of BamABCDE complex)
MRIGSSHLLAPLGLLLALLAAGCTRQIGKPLSVADADGVVVGKSTKRDILRAFGEPNSRSTANGAEMWQYVHSVGRAQAFGINPTADARALTVRFDNEVVAKCIISRTTSRNGASQTDNRDCGAL